MKLSALKIWLSLAPVILSRSSLPERGQTISMHMHKIHLNRVLFLDYRSDEIK